MMKEDPKSQCPECGQPLPEADRHGLCPACLMKQAMATKTLDSEKAAPAAAPPPSPDEIADSFPQFEIVECLGRGGMGVVYKARQKSLDRWVAIKILAPDRRGEERFAERFAREAQVLAKLNHPSIVTVYDHGETGGLFYIVMEYVDGVNLRDLLRDGKMAPEQALAIVPPICEALDFAHGKGVIHRDIKPENLLLDRDGRVKIADFGIAALVGGTSEISGTPPYMAPEQSRGTADRRADIYALGVVLYEMLTGERPGRGEVVAPSKKVEVDVRIDEMVLRALEKEPERRYQTASELRTVLQTVASGRPPTNSPSAKSAAAKPRGGRWASRRKLAAALLGIASAVILIVSLMRPTLYNVDAKESDDAQLRAFAQVWKKGSLFGKEDGFYQLNVQTRGVDSRISQRRVDIPWSEIAYARQVAGHTLKLEDAALGEAGIRWSPDDRSVSFAIAGIELGTFDTRKWAWVAPDPFRQRLTGSWKPELPGKVDARMVDTAVHIWVDGRWESSVTLFGKTYQSSGSWTLDGERMTMLKEASSNSGEIGKTEAFHIVEASPERLVLKQVEEGGGGKETTFHRISDAPPRRIAERDPSGAAAFTGRWVWDEDGTGDRVWLTISGDGSAILQGGDAGLGGRFRSRAKWTVADGKLAIAFAGEPMVATLSPDGETLTGAVDAREGVRVAFAKTGETPPPDADLDQLEDQARQVIAAIRENDDDRLRSLGASHLRDWVDAMPHLALVLRENYQQLAGDDAFDLRPTESANKGETGAVRCTGPEALGGKCVILSFIKTEDGWRNSLIQMTAEDVRLHEQLEAMPDQSAQP